MITQANTKMISSQIAKQIIGVLENSVGDAIKEDVRSHRLVTQNSTPTRIWDLINTGLCQYSSASGLMTVISKRGPWEMAVLFDSNSKDVLTIMREKRFEEIKRTKKQRKSMHYLEAFSKALNGDLIAPNKQQSIFDEEVDCALSDEATNIVERMVASFSVEKSIIKHHALVLFDSVDYQLTSARVVLIDSDLDIVCSDDWSPYISANESVVVETVSVETKAYDNPARGLKLTEKATKRQKNNSIIKEQEEIRNA